MPDWSLVAIAFAVSVLSGWLGIGGGIVMAPALLYGPPLLGWPGLDVRTVTGLTIAQGLFACSAGAWRHDAARHVDRALAAWMGGVIVVAALAGALGSAWVPARALLGLFAVLAAAAAGLLCVPAPGAEGTGDAAPRSPAPFSRPRAVACAAAVGLLGGSVGQGGSFLLIPLMVHVLRVPTRVALGSNLAVVLCASVAGFAGKLATGQVAVGPAALVALGALPGATLGAACSFRTPPRWLRRALAVVVGAAAIRVAADALGA